MVGTGSQDLEGNELAIPLDVPNLAKGVKTGNRVLLDDGHLELLVTDVRGENVITRVLTGGLLTSNKGVNFAWCESGDPQFYRKRSH